MRYATAVPDDSGAQTPPSISGLLPDNTFVGRQRELAAVLGAFDAGKRLITVTGIGGAGKTRLALEISQQAGRPTTFLDLSAARQPADVLIAMAGALTGRCPDESATGISAGLATLGAALVVLDAMEGVLPEACEMLSRWHRASPEVWFVVTSRIPLGIASEQIVQLSALEPDDSLALLVDRARSLDFRFDPDEDRSSLQQVVTRLEGIPLAIELAAARTQTLSPRQLWERLKEPLRLLRGHRRDADPRHATMEATLEWSWELLSDAERTVLVRLWVFPKSFGMRAAEAVSTPEDAEGEWETSAISVVESLVQHGLIRLLDTPRGRRLRLLEVVRDYVGRRVDATLRSELEQRHTAHFMELIAPAVEAGGLARQLMDACDPSLPPEVDDLEAIIGRPGTSPSDRVGAAMALVATLSRVGPTSRVQRVLSQVEASLAHSPRTSPLDEARLDLAKAYAKRFLGTTGPTEERLRVGVDTALAAHRPVLASLLLHYRGRQALLDGQAETAADLYDEALKLAQASGSDEALAQCVQGPTIMHFRVGHIDDALRAAEGVITLAERLGYRRLRCMWLSNYSVGLFHRGRIDEALHAAQRASALAEETGSLDLVSVNLTHLAEYAIAAGALDDAHRWLDASKQLAERAAVQPANPLGSINRIDCWLGMVEGDLERAEAAIEPSRWSAHTSHPDLVSAVSHSCRGVLTLLRGELVAALQILDRAVAFRERWSFQQVDMDLVLGFRALARARTGQAAGARSDLAAASSGVGRGLRIDSTLHLLTLATHLALDEPEAEASAQAALLSLRRPEGDTVPYAEVVVAGRLLEATLASRDEGGKTLHVGAGGSWVQVSGEPVLDLTRRRVPQRLLLCLLDARARSEEGSVSTEELLEAAWPRDKAKRSSLENRLWAALSKLRKAGFDQVIERVNGGYRIAADVTVYRETVGTPP
ncbi:MAG: hypothetical protein KTR31_22050 [Myxococcales bacterium]|nr:hypothetical protein [Myxococcales bacterium]